MRRSFLPAIGAVLALMAAFGVAGGAARANGVPQLVKLTYLEGVSNFGPHDAEGVLEFSFAEAYARVDVKYLPPADGYTYEGWLTGGDARALKVGEIVTGPDGVGVLEAKLEQLDSYDYSLFVVAARSSTTPADDLPTDITIAGRFTTLGDEPGTDVRPGVLPDTGEEPGAGNLERAVPDRPCHDGGGWPGVRVPAAQTQPEAGPMIKGLYSAFTAMEAAWRYQDVLANNIANANTTGFKREFATQQPFDDVLLTQQAGVPAPLTARIQAVVGQIGTGAFIADFTTDFQPGMIRQTENELDLAATTGFFRVQDADGQVFYTRDGRFGRDAEGGLVTSHGYRVLDVDGQPITLPSSPVSVNADGVILDGEGATVAAIDVQDFEPGQLQRAGEAFFTATGDPRAMASGPGIRQGFLEGSNSILVEEMTSLLTVQRAYQANQAVLAQLDGTLEQAAGELGRL